VGELARARALFDPSGTIFAIKRRMGLSDPLHINGHSFTPQEISAQILRKMKRDAEAYLGEPVDKAVITVPAYFNETSRQATKEAGQIAGFEVLRILNEPTAAALAYGLGRGDGERVMVVDLGGGTFDVTILEFSNGVYEVRATAGDTCLGGDDWTLLIARHLREKCEKEWGCLISTRPEIAHRIWMAAEATKLDLSSQPATHIHLPCLEDANGKMRSWDAPFEREAFAEITQSLLDRVRLPIQSVLRDASLSFKDMDKIILVGGATRMAQIREFIEKLSDKNPYIDIDPDLAVGLGAAVQAGILTGEMGDMVLVDVIPLSLGIETRGGIFTKLIPRNSSIPTSCNQIFTTAEDDTTEVEIHVLQGERELAGHNVSLGRFRLTDIPPLPKGAAKIEVGFAVDADGILNVSASDVYTGAEQTMTIRPGRLDKGEISRLAEEAGRLRLSDQRERDHIMARIAADDVITAAASTLQKFAAQDLPAITGALAESRRLLEDGEINELKTSIDRLKGLMNEAYAKL
jgi:molecular chaperone DnaK